MAKYSKRASEKVEENMHEMKKGKLRSGRSGKKVTSRKQAIAIGLSQAREEGAKVPRKSSSKKTATKSKSSSRSKSTVTKRKSATKKRTASKKSASKKGSRGKKSSSKTGGSKASRRKSSSGRSK